MNRVIKIFVAMAIIATMLLLPLNVQAAGKDYSAVFNVDYYYNQYPDLQVAVGKNANKLLNHFVTSGMREGRRGNEEFNVWAYMANYVDLQTAYGTTDLTAYYIHYMQHGKAEGRNASGNAGGTVINKTVVATYSTKYRVKTNRAANLELAAARIHGYSIEPGVTFSFSDSILSRTEANGYVDAPSYADGKVVSSIGGGICQVSSTLYAALKSYQIPVLERYVHSLPVDYVPKGYDATISEGRKDLKFTNTYQETLQIQAQAVDGKLTITIMKDK